MPSPGSQTTTVIAIHRPNPPDWPAAILSYIVPGLGQIYQGRVSKGLLFLICLYVMFFYGMYLGSGTVVLGDEVHHIQGNVYLPDVAHKEKNNPWKLPRLLGNLWNRPQFAGQVWIGAAAWPAIWQYVNFDENQKRGPLLGTFERCPEEQALNELQAAGDKTWDLGWVFTLIAGVLNILVIYDALVGPVLLVEHSVRTKEAPA